MATEVTVSVDTQKQPAEEDPTVVKRRDELQQHWLRGFRTGWFLALVATSSGFLTVQFFLNGRFFLSGR